MALGEAILQEFVPILLLREPVGRVGRFSGTYLSSDDGLGLIVPGGTVVVERLAGPPAGVAVDFVTANDTDAADDELDAAIREAAQGTGGHFLFAVDGTRGVSGARASPPIPAPTRLPGRWAVEP